MPCRSRQLSLHERWTAAALAEVGTGPAGERVLFDGAPSAGHGWFRTQLVGLEPRCVLRLRSRNAEEIERSLRRLGALLEARRSSGTEGRTGIALLLSYEFFRPESARRGARAFPTLIAFAVDRTIERDDDRWMLTARCETGDDAERALDRWSARLSEPRRQIDRGPVAGPCGAARTSLPRTAYLAAVRTLQDRIAEGQIYQANLCQRFDIPWRGDPLRFYERVAADHAVPHSAYIACDGLSVASLSPETFVTIRDGAIETFPIKGTRARSADGGTDAAAAADLLASEKDRAELLMIVDLERNDLGRLCKVGSVEVPEWASLRSYPTVHHLVAHVRGELRPQVGWPQMLRAIFPGGSITGAPKLRAISILESLEPLERGPFTGSLFWCGDDGSVDSSILIRTALFGPGIASVGAGGGIVADSEPQAEWEESNHKARVLTTALGFDPEELA